MAFDLDKSIRANIRQLVAYSSARGEFSGSAQVFLDANENSFGSPLATNYHRYPDPQQIEIKKRIAKQNGVLPTEIFVGNGSDEAIDLLFRIFCEPRVDNILICPPTYGMYEVAAAINDVTVRRANLTGDFHLEVNAVLNAISENTKLVFLCSPNNPTGNLMRREHVLEIARSFSGIVVVDEAYIHFSDSNSLVSELNQIPNLVVLQTFSKAWGLAGLRVGLAFANEHIIEVFNKVKPPYNVSQVAQEWILFALENRPQVEGTIAEIVRERKKLADKLHQYPFVTCVYPSDANFVLVKTANATDVYKFLLNEKIVVRNRSNIVLCEGCIRITIGVSDENQALLKALKKYEEGLIY